MKSKTKKYSTGGQFDPSSLIGPALSMVPGVGQFAPLLNMFMQPDNTPSASIGGKKLMGPATSPGIGNYNYGGPIDPPITVYPQKFRTNIVPESTRIQPQQFAQRLVPGYGGSPLTSQEVQMDHRREAYKQTDQYLINKAASEQALINVDRAANPTRYVSTSQPAHPHDRLSGLGSSAKAKSVDRFREKAYGGDIDISNTATQIKGNPNVTDGNYYPEMNVRLDHDEVVKNNFVYSNRLSNTLTGNTFAEDAAKIEKSTSKAEKRRSMFGDKESINTVKWNDKNMEGLKQFQEIAATAMGLRNDSNSFENGGKLPSEGFDVKGFQDWYNTLPGVKPLSPDGVWGPQTEAAYNRAGAGFNNPNTSPISERYPPKINKSIMPQIGFLANTTLTPNTQNADIQASGYPGDQINPNLFPGIRQGEDVMLRTQNPQDPMSQVPQGYADWARGLGTSPQNPNATPTDPRNNQYETPITWGDALQGVEVASKFMGLIGGPEKENVNLDNTNLTRQSFDVNPQLYQSQRNLSNQVNSLDTSNINLRRALFNQAYAGKMNNDSQVLSNYQNMNNSANIQYEDRVSNQRRYNVGQQNYTNDINARNRGAFNTLKDNAFTSLGNFGEGLNQKVYANDTVRLYEEMYPQVAKRITSALSQDDLLKLLKLRNPYG